MDAIKNGLCKHSCVVLPLYRQVFLIGSSVLYCIDIFTDIFVAVETVSNPKQRGLGSTMILFVVLPLFYSNYVALSNRCERARWYTNNNAVDKASVFWIDDEAIKGRPIKKCMFPYSWSNRRHVLFNCLCLLQLGILIDVLEMLSHQEQGISQISKQYSHYTYIRRLEVMLENCPQLALQVCALTEDNEWLSRISLAGGEITTADVIKLFSIFCSVVSLPLALCADEESGRYSNRVSYDFMKKIRICKIFTIPLQIVVLYTGFLLMICARLALIALLYKVCNSIENIELNIHESNIVPVLILEAHHLIVFLVYLVNQALARRNKSVQIIYELKWCNMFLSFCLFSFSELFIILLQFPVRYRTAVRIRAKEKDGGDERFKSFYAFYILNLVEFGAMAWFCQSSQERVYCGMAYGSIACYLTSGVCFMFYHSPLLHPDSLKEREQYKNNYRTFLLQGQLVQCVASLRDKPRLQQKLFGNGETIQCGAQETQEHCRPSLATQCLAKLRPAISGYQDIGCNPELGKLLPCDMQNPQPI